MCMRAAEIGVKLFRTKRSGHAVRQRRRDSETI